jgi:hypothetical protein
MVPGERDTRLRDTLSNSTRRTRLSHLSRGTSISFPWRSTGIAPPGCASSHNTSKSGYGQGQFKPLLLSGLVRHNTNEEGYCHGTTATNVAV